MNCLHCNLPCLLVGRKGNKIEYKCSVCHEVFFEEEENDIGQKTSYSKGKKRSSKKHLSSSDIQN